MYVNTWETCDYMPKMEQRVPQTTIHS